MKGFEGNRKPCPMRGVSGPVTLEGSRDTRFADILDEGGHDART